MISGIVLLDENPSVIPSFAVEELYQLQLRRGKLPKKYTYTNLYAQRNSLKAKFRTQLGICGRARSAVYHLVQDLANILRYLLACREANRSWLAYSARSHYR